MDVAVGRYVTPIVFRETLPGSDAFWQFGKATVINADMIPGKPAGKVVTKSTPIAHVSAGNGYVRVHKPGHYQELIPRVEDYRRLARRPKVPVNGNIPRVVEMAADIEPGKGPPGKGGPDGPDGGDGGEKPETGTPFAPSSLKPVKIFKMDGIQVDDTPVSSESQFGGGTTTTLSSYKSMSGTVTPGTESYPSRRSSLLSVDQVEEGYNEDDKMNWVNESNQQKDEEPGVNLTDMATNAARNVASGVAGAARGAADLAATVGPPAASMLASGASNLASTALNAVPPALDMVRQGVNQLTNLGYQAFDKFDEVATEWANENARRAQEPPVRPRQVTDEHPEDLLHRVNDYNFNYGEGSSRGTIKATWFQTPLNIGSDRNPNPNPNNPTPNPPLVTQEHGSGVRPPPLGFLQRQAAAIRPTVMNERLARLTSASNPPPAQNPPEPPAQNRRSGRRTQDVFAFYPGEADTGSALSRNQRTGSISSRDGKGRRYQKKRGTRNKYTPIN